MALLALLALVAGIVSDLTNGRFWAAHALLAGLVASVVVVMLSVAVLNEALERRSRQRWSILAQFVMFELIQNARMVWLGVLDVTGLAPADSANDSLEHRAAIVRDSARLSAALRATVDDPDGHARLHEEVALLAEHADEVLGRWASVMLNAAMYAEIMDRHVELAGDLAWIGGLLDTSHPPEDVRRQRRARSSAAVQIEGRRDGGWLADRLVLITQLAEALDRGTLELALRIVPVQWWESRLGTTPPP
jgi:hypothetical protein